MVDLVGGLGAGVFDFLALAFTLPRFSFVVRGGHWVVLSGMGPSCWRNCFRRAWSCLAASTASSQSVAYTSAVKDAVIRTGQMVSLAP